MGVILPASKQAHLITLESLWSLVILHSFDTCIWLGFCSIKGYSLLGLTLADT